MTHILVVEDELSIREALMDWLTFEGYDVQGAADGQEALEKAMAAPPDLIISDITMPRMTGYELLAALQQIPALRSVPFIFLTAHADRASMRTGMNLGADDYIPKPFTQEEVLTAVSSRLGRRQAIQGAAQDEVDAVKRNLVKIITHELKTPLTLITLVQEMISQEIEDLSPEEVRDLADSLQWGTYRLAHLVEQVTIMAQVETGMLTAQKVQHSAGWMGLGELLACALQQAREYAHQTQQSPVEIGWSGGDSSADLQIWGDRHLLSQALTELLLNALNYSTPGTPIQIQLSQEGETLWVRIENQSDGIGEEDLARMRLPFEQIDREKREQQGLGLGLSVVDQIVHLHQGSLEVAFHQGRGLQVSVGLPASPS
jgi:signal transduction histidine kinase